MFEVQIDNDNYGKVESLLVAIDFCMYRLAIAKKEWCLHHRNDKIL